MGIAKKVKYTAKGLYYLGRTVNTVRKYTTKTFVVATVIGAAYASAGNR